MAVSFKANLLGGKCIKLIVSRHKNASVNRNRGLETAYEAHLFRRSAPGEQHRAGSSVERVQPVAGLRTYAPHEGVRLPVSRRDHRRATPEVVRTPGDCDSRRGGGTNAERHEAAWCARAANAAAVGVEDDRGARRCRIGRRGIDDSSARHLPTLHAFAYHAVTCPDAAEVRAIEHIRYSILA